MERRIKDIEIERQRVLDAHRAHISAIDADLLDARDAYVKWQWGAEGRETVTEETAITDLGLSTRIMNCLRNHFVYRGFGDDVTVGHVLQMLPSELLSLPYFGRRSLAELEMALRVNGFALRTTSREVE